VEHQRLQIFKGKKVIAASNFIFQGFPACEFAVLNGGVTKEKFRANFQLCIPFIIL